MWYAKTDVNVLILTNKEILKMTDIDCSDIKYRKYLAEDIKKLRPLYELRANRSCDAAPLTCFLYKNEYELLYYHDENRALTLMFKDKEGKIYGFIPYCRAEELAKYFKLQEHYYNEVLGIPLVINSADYEGVEFLKKAGLLDNYEIEETEDLRDYIYDGDSLRTLSGKKMTKKRNHVNRFMRDYEGRWEYRTLTYEDKDEIIEFENRWVKTKLDDAAEDEKEDLLGEKAGIEDIVLTPELYSQFKMGGIYIDGKLSAFSIGDYNEREKMAIISVEKADSSIQGLYQIINKEFLVHEFPSALIVNREDDVGIEGLRKAKMSYHPITFEGKFTLRQKVRFLCKNEYERTIALFRERFGDDEEFISEYYGQDNNKRIAVMEDEGGNIISMAHVMKYNVRYETGREETVSYILCVATTKSMEHRGCMTKLMNYVMNYLKMTGEPWCFLIPVDREIYKSLGFVHEWKPKEAELDILYADEGLDTACAAMLNAESFERPHGIKKLI